MTASVAAEPAGVVALITPWNYPLMQAVCKVAPALAAGCAVLLKPSPLASLTDKGKEERAAAKRAAKEKAEHLEKDLRRAEHQLNNQGTEFQHKQAIGEEFKKEIAERAEKLMNKDLTRKQRDSFVNRILRCFSVCFWIQGCNAPQVEGFIANIKLKPDAVGKCQQPFKLSAYDQYRVEVHEDVLIDEGKAEWAPPGMALAFALSLIHI